jgi:hypothetical protein
MKKLLFALLVSVGLVTSTATALFQQTTAQAQMSCPTGPELRITLQIPVNGQYAVWLRAGNGPDSPDMVMARFDSETSCVDFKVPTSEAFEWLGGANGSIRKNFNAGQHTIYLNVSGGELHADRLVVTGNLDCIPQNEGENCLDQNVDIRVDGLRADQAVDSAIQLNTVISGAPLSSPKVSYYFNSSTEAYATRTSAPYCLFVNNGSCASGDLSFLGAGSHTVKIVVSADNMETTTRIIPFRFITQSNTGLDPTKNPPPSPTTTPVSANPTPSPTPTPSPSPTPSVPTTPKTTVTPAKTNTVVVSTAADPKNRTISGDKSVTVTPSQPLVTGDTVKYTVGSSDVGSKIITDEDTDPSVAVDFKKIPDGETNISATVNRADGSTEIYGAKTRVDNSNYSTSKSWFMSTGIRLLFSTIALILLVVGGVLIYRAIKKRQEYALYHNISDYQYVQPQSDVGAYALPPLALVFFGIGAIFSSLSGAASARVGIIADLTKASLPTEYYVVDEQGRSYVYMTGETHQHSNSPNPTPTTPTTPPTTPTTPTTPPTTPTTPTTPPVTNSNYASNLALLKANPFRNTLEDNSPHRNTPSVELYDKADLYTDYRDYEKNIGTYNGNEWFPGGVFRNVGAGTFRAGCEVSHFGYDDPIVFPGQPGVSHLHMFIGNTDTNAYSTYDTMLNSGGSTCNGGELNRTGYWVPAMFDGEGNIVVPARVLFYYKTEQPVGIGKVVTYPDNMQIVADRKNNDQRDPSASTFNCNNIYNGLKATPSANLPTCTSPHASWHGVLEYKIQFDHCWNGKTDTVGDWEANAGKGGKGPNLVPPNIHWFSSLCPASHPYLLPALVTHIFYDIKLGEDTSKWFLSSDVDPTSRTRGSTVRGSTAHADWFGAWNKQINQEWNQNCSNILSAECTGGWLADPLNKPNPRALRLHKDWVTGADRPNSRIPVSEMYPYLCPGGQPISPANGYENAAYCRK